MGDSETFQPRLSANWRRGSMYPLAMGRWVKSYHPGEGMRMRSIKPIYGHLAPGDASMGVLAKVLQEATGGVELQKLHLLVAPGTHKLPRKVHCFDRRTRSHLGMTSITEEEVDVLRMYENLLKYELSFTNEYFSAKDLTCDTEIVSMLFDRTSDGLFMSNLNFNRIGKELCSIGIQADRKHRIKALRQPKIPVRLRVLKEPKQAAPVWH